MREQYVPEPQAVSRYVMAANERPYPFVSEATPTWQTFINAIGGQVTTAINAE